MSYPGSPVKGQGPGDGEERHANHKVIENGGSKENLFHFGMISMIYFFGEYR